MPIRPGVTALGAAALLLGGCAYVGPPQPPSPKIPQKIEGLTAFERGRHLVIAFYLPGVTTDGVEIRRFDDVDLRVGRDLESATRLDAGVDVPGPVHVEVDAGPWAGSEVVVAVRTAVRKARYSEWSSPRRLRVVPPLGAPVAHADAVAEGVRLTWTAPEQVSGLSWRVYRRTEAQKDAALLGRSEKPEYVDAGTQYGQTYIYTVQSVLSAGDAEAESDISAPVGITPADKFPPAVPANLAAVAGVHNIQLSWTPNTEPDLKGYYVYRAVDGGGFSRDPELLPTPAYTDRAAEPGKRYRYAVSAVDQAGNESRRSAEVEAAAQ